MGSKNRGQAASLREDLLKSGKDYSYFQAVRLLRLFMDCGSGARIRTRPELSFAFPESDISGISYSGDEKGGSYDISATFLGLYGVSSPLPNFYTEDLFLEESEDRSTCRDFLDIFNHRFYDLIFSCWKKYRLFFRVTEDRSRDQAKKLFCLLGLGETELREEVHPERLLKYLGLLTQWPRSALGLRTILRDVTGMDMLDIEPCCPRRVKIPADQQCCLGQACSCLGVDTVIGSEVPDRQGKFRIHVGPLTSDEFRDFVPGGSSFRMVTNLARFFLLAPLEYEIRVSLKKEEVQGTCLGAGIWSGLGTDTWLFTGEMPADGTATFYPQDMQEDKTPIASTVNRTTGIYSRCSAEARSTGGTHGKC